MEKRSHIANRACAGWVTALAVLGLLLPVAASAGGRLYRYLDEQGRVTISYTVPAHLAAGGYHILDARSGLVIDTVAPELTPEELAAQQQRERLVTQCRQTIERVTTLYGSMQDIDTAQRHTERAIETRIAHTETNLAVEQRRLEEHQSEAAYRERTGRPVTEDLLESIARSRAQIRTLEAEIEQRRKERAEAADRFAEDRRVFEAGSCEAVAQGF
jgi:hypothetical protein